MRHDKDKAMVNAKKEIINLSHMMTVYGFSEERMVVRKTCQFNIVISERDGEVFFSLKANPL